MVGWCVYLHGGVVVGVQGALRHHREGLADQHLGERRLGVPNHRGQDVYGRLQRSHPKPELNTTQDNLMAVYNNHTHNYLNTAQDNSMAVCNNHTHD